VPDEAFQAASAVFGEKELADLTMAIGLMNAYNRLGVSFRNGDPVTVTLLERLPASVLKLDQTYVGRAATDNASLAIVRSTVEMAHALGLLVVAEGIEDEPTRRTLSELGCERGQGFHFSPPRPLTELLRG